jgi:hypothetical protein
MAWDVRPCQVAHSPHEGRDLLDSPGSTNTALLAFSNRQRIQTPIIWLKKVSVAMQDPLLARRRHSPHLARTEQAMTANDSYQRFNELEALPR